MAKKSAALSGLEYLADPAQHAVPPICVVFGSEALLKREVLAALRGQVLRDADQEFSTTVLNGDDAEPRDVFDALSSASLFGGGKSVIVIEDADDFVSEHRARLERYADRPHATGALILETSSWPSTTKLYKKLAESGLQIDCDSPKPAALVKWLTGRAKSKHQASLDGDAAEEMLDLIGPEMGLLDQELARLALLAVPSLGQPIPKITAKLVRDHVGSWRARKVWDLVDAAAAGDAGEALLQLDRLIRAGESPQAILGQIGSSLRRFTTATRIFLAAETHRRRVSLADALREAGTPPFVLGKAADQLKQLGRDRAGKLLHWVLEADLATKGPSSSPARARLVLEQLLCRMARQAVPAAL